MTNRLIVAAALLIAIVMTATACPKKGGASAPTPTTSSAVPTPTESDGMGPPPENPTAVVEGEFPQTTPEASVSGEEAPAETPTEASSGADFAMPVYEVPSAPDDKLAKYRLFWLGMNVEYWARLCVGPKEDVQPTVEATPESDAAKKKVVAPPAYLVLPNIVREPDIQRFINSNPADPSLDHITFSFFHDRLMTIEVFYRTGYFQNVILDDFLVKLKEAYGDPAQEDWKAKGVEGTLVWETGAYNLRLSIYSGRPFALKFTDVGLKTEYTLYVEDLKKKASAKKVDEIGF